MRNQRKSTAALYAVLAVVLAAMLAAAIVSAWIRWRDGELAPLDLSGAVSVVLSITLFALGLVISGPPNQPPLGETMETKKLELARQVKHEWTKEMRSRGLRDKLRMAVRWQSAAESDPRSPLATALHRSGQLDELIAETGRQVRDKKLARLVVTGDMGAGKTAACVLLTSELGDNGPLVPVPFQLASWDPHTCLHEWMTGELIANYPFLYDQEFDTQVASALVDQHILPILDGLDELRDPDAALRRIQDELDGKSFVLTSRTAKFAAANARNRLSEALIVQLQPFLANEARDILRNRAPGDAKLTPLIDELNDRPTGPAAEALRTPFMLSLALGSDEAVPKELLTATGSEAVDGIERYLLGSFIARTYPPKRIRKEDPNAAGKARQYLRFLAHHVDPETHRLAWWHLPEAVPRAVFLSVAVFTAAVACSALAAAFFWLFERPWLGFWIGLTAGVVGAFIVELIPQEDPRRTRPSLRSFRAPTPYGLLRILGFGLMGGAACAAMVWALYGPPYYVVIGGTLSGLTFAAARYVSQPSDDMKAVTPDRLLSTDRAAVVYAFLTGGIAGALIGAYLGGSFPAGHRHQVDDLPILTLPTPVLALLGALGGGALSAVGLALMAVGSSAWGRFLLTRVWLSARRSTPLRLMKFLRDARQHEVLRQVNGYYEFRHSLLQDYLADPNSGVSAGPPASP